MSNTIKTLLMVVACVALTAPAWATDFSLGCDSEARNGWYEYDISNHDGLDFNGTGYGDGGDADTNTPGKQDNNVDHWTLQNNVSWSTDRDHTHLTGGLKPGGGGTHSIKGYNCSWVWQIVDETKAPWWPDEEYGWQHGTNRCWLPDGQSKTISSSFWAYFTEAQTQKVDYRAYGYIGTATPQPTAFDPTHTVIDTDTTGPDPTVWSYLGGSVATGAKDAWQSFGLKVELPDAQPRYVAWAYHFIDTTIGGEEIDGPIYFDDVIIEGKCAYDAPELGTWLLLACTGVLGGVIRRRRTT